MRRSGAPSQMVGGQPPLKRTKFNTPFMTGSNTCSSQQSVLVTPSPISEDGREGSDSSLQRVLQDIRKNPVVESEHAHTAPLKNQLRLNLPGKENFTPNIERSETASPFSLSVGSLEPQPHHVSSAASSNECGNDHSTEHHINEHTDIRVKPKLGMRRGGFKPPTKSSSSHGPHMDAPANNEQEPNSTSPKSGVESNKAESSSGTKYYNVMWCKYSKKKHKKWEGDAILIVNGGSVALKDMDGKDIGKGAGYKQSELSALSDGSTLVVGGKELEIMSEMSEESWKSGQCFTGAGTTNSSSTATPIASTSYIKPKPVKKFVNPSLSRPSTVNKDPALPLHNPDLPNALVMPRPNSKHQMLHNQGGLQLVDVVVDPHLSSHLRPHQREGVVFLYECVTGMRDYSGRGAILADEMGLGKTLQCITALWTLYKQGPYGRKPLVKRTLIITPGSLVKNWEKEFKKWLGSERLKVFSVSSDKRVEEFLRSSIHPVLIISYEMFLKSHETLHPVHFDLIICDEGHRLKNNAAKTTSLIMGLPSRRRIMLTGTPIQNDLQEFYSLVEFCNPGVLGSHSAFKKVYEEPIVHSRQPNATREEKDIGERRAVELKRLTSLFCLRRTQEINKKYLPPKVESVVFCKMSTLQFTVYKHLLGSHLVRSCLRRSTTFSPHLVCIGALKKLCNSPSFIYEAAAIAGVCDERSAREDSPLSTDGDDDGLYQGIASCFPPSYDPQSLHVEDSGKLLVLSELLHYLLTTTREKVVLVSNYTQALDMLQRLCDIHCYGYLRLDGSTPASKRMSLVEKFNSKYSSESIFLLSSKAGGVGLNLVGASRLILYDIDWNPANDLQAMARVWRDGQPRKVYIYRLITTGTIEEKIFQRQISKQGLNSVVDFDNTQIKGNSSVKFSIEELKDLFTLSENTSCETHDLLNCNCGENEMESQALSIPTSSTSTSHKNASMDELFQWQHYKEPVDQTSLCDKALLQASRNVSFVFQNESVTSSLQS